MTVEALTERHARQKAHVLLLSMGWTEWEITDCWEVDDYDW